VGSFTFNIIKLLLFIYQVSHKEIERIAFKMHKMFDVGLLQPVAVTIYEYYSPGEILTHTHTHTHTHTNNALKTEHI